MKCLSCDAQWVPAGYYRKKLRERKFMSIFRLQNALGSEEFFGCTFGRCLLPELPTPQMALRD
jgi:hypothetical protein